MILSNSKLFSTLTQKLSWFALNSQAHSRNLSQVEVPGAKQQVAPSFNQYVKDAGKKNPQAMLKNSKEEISRENEILAMTENLSNYQMATSIYKKYMSLVRVVVGKSGGGG